MARSGKSKASRDQRKQRKAQRRRTRKERRHLTAAALPGAALPPWDPVTEGIRGWAWRRGTDFWTAARLLRERTDLPDEVWTEARVAALSTEVLVEHLARLGVRTDRDSFCAMSDRYLSINDIVEEVWAEVRPKAPMAVLDHDLLRLATRDLYRRWVDRWPCLEDVADRWGDGLVDEPTAAAVLARAARTAEDLKVYLADPAVSLDDMILGVTGLMGWFVTLVDEAEGAALEDPESALIAIPPLEMLAEHFDGDAEGQLDVLRALATVWTANDARPLAAGRLLAWSRERASCAGVVALAEAWRVNDPECAPEQRAEVLRMLQEALAADWSGLEILEVASRVEELERLPMG